MALWLVAKDRDTDNHPGKGDNTPLILRGFPNPSPTPTRLARAYGNTIRVDLVEGDYPTTVTTPLPAPIPQTTHIMARIDSTPYLCPNATLGKYNPITLPKLALRHP